MDTAAVMKNLDLVVTSDTAIAHLAGALGVPVWLALAHVPDWRWLHDRDDTPWYLSMRLFRQEARGDWPAVFERMAAALRALTGARAPRPAAPIPVPVSPGELLDKLTILRIKSRRIPDPAKLTHVRNELALLDAARRRHLPPLQALDDLAAQLESVNDTLWQIEDDIRALDAAGDFGPAFVALAQRVYRTNDLRTALKRQIDALLGSDLVEQKAYASHTATAGRPGAPSSSGNLRRD